MTKKKVEFKTYNELLDILRDHGLNISSTRNAKMILKSRGYYNLVNRYKNDFYLPETHEFKEFTTIETLYGYHRMEDDLRNILFRFTITFEQSLKENMSYTLSYNLGIKPEEYLNPHNFRSRHVSRTRNILAHISKIQDTKNNPTKYYRDNYETIPPWILLNNTMLGETRMFFSIFPFKLKRYVVKNMFSLTSEEKYWELIDKSLTLKQKKELNRSLSLETQQLEKQILKNMDNNLIDLFSIILRMINYFRNALAHGDRITHLVTQDSLNYKLISAFTYKAISKKKFYSENWGKNLFGILIGLLLSLNKYDGLLLVQKLMDWKEQNTQNYNDEKTFNLLIKSCGLPLDFIDILSEIRKSLHYMSVDSPKFSFREGKKFLDHLNYHKN